MEEEQIMKIGFYASDVYGNVTDLKREYPPDTDEIDTITWWVKEFKYFMKSMGFSDQMVDRIVYVERDEQLVSSTGEVYIDALD